MCFMFVLILASSMVFGVRVNVCGVVCVVVCFLRLGCCDFCLICNAYSLRCSFMGRVCVCVCCTPSCYSECGVLCYL